MTWYDDLRDVEDRVRELAKLPPTLARLEEAVSAIAKARGKPVDTRRDGDILHVASAVRHLVTLEGDEFVDFVDEPGIRYSSLERMAWHLNNFPFLPRHAAATADRLRREGKDARTPLVKDIMVEVEREWPRPKATRR